MQSCRAAERHARVHGCCKRASALETLAQTLPAGETGIHNNMPASAIPRIHVVDSYNTRFLLYLQHFVISRACTCHNSITSSTGLHKHIGIMVLVTGRLRAWYFTANTFQQLFWWFSHLSSPAICTGRHNMSHSYSRASLSTTKAIGPKPCMVSQMYITSHSGG